METVIWQTFGDALFSLAREKKRLTEWREEARAIAEILEGEEAFMALVSGPWPSRELRVKLLRDIFGGRVSPEILEWMTLAVEWGTFRHMKEMLRRFAEKADQALGTAQVTVTVPCKLEKRQRRRIERYLKKITGIPPENVRYSTDTKLIGGMTVCIGDQVLDGSVRTKLRRMEEDLLTLDGKAGKESL